MEKLTKISKETLVPIGLVITCFCAVWFLAKLDGRVVYNTNEINILKKEISAMKESLNSIEKNVLIISSIMQKDGDAFKN